MSLGYTLAMAGALCVAIGVQTYRLESAQGDLERERRLWAQERATAAERAAAESEDHRRREADLRRYYDEEIQHGSISREQAEAAAADAYRVADERLRKQLAAASAARDRARAAAAAAGKCEPAAAAGDMSAVLLRWAAEDSGAADQISGFAEGSHGAWADCKRAYERAREVAQPEEH